MIIWKSTDHQTEPFMYCLQGQCLLTNAPGTVSDSQLTDLHIKTLWQEGSWNSWQWMNLCKRLRVTMDALVFQVKHPERFMSHCFYSVIVFCSFCTRSIWTARFADKYACLPNVGALWQWQHIVKAAHGEGSVSEKQRCIDLRDNCLRSSAVDPSCKPASFWVLHCISKTIPQG